ncbi:MAG: tripartite tricarboxylate transporter substrate-binding protein [Piscinibacter sp.]
MLAQQAFPQRPVTLVVPFAPGGIADLTARAVAEAMARPLGQPVVVDNKPSAGSIVASAAVAQARPDGHTLLLMSNANAVSASLFRKLPYDVQRDFAPIGSIGFFELALVVDARSRFATLAELLAHAKARPGQLTIATIAVGSTQHLAAELLKSTLGIDALIVPYKGTPAVLTALRAGDADVAVEILGPVLPQVSGHVLRVLATTGEQRSVALPEVPTVQQASGVHYAVASWNALAAPAGTPPAVIERLAAVLRQALDDAAVRQRLAALSVRAEAGSPQALRSLLDSEIRRWAAVIRAAKIEPE